MDFVHHYYIIMTFINVIIMTRIKIIIIVIIFIIIDIFPVDSHNCEAGVQLASS